MDMSRDDNVQGILGAIGPFWAKWGAGTSSAEPEFFCVVIQTTGNFATVDFHRIWSRNVIRCPVDESGKIFWKIFTLGVIFPQNPKSLVGQTGTSLRAGYRSQDALQRDIVYSTF